MAMPTGYSTFLNKILQKQQKNYPNVYLNGLQFHSYISCGMSENF